MPIAVRFPKSSGRGRAGVGVLAWWVMVLLPGCSSPKAAAPAPQSSSVIAAGPSNPANSNSPGPSDPFVAAVRAGTMSGYPQATIGQAFEGAFSDAQWHSEQPKEGIRVVTFTGSLPANMRQGCGAAKAGQTASPCAQDAKVTFEWTFTSDGRLFHLSHVDPESWPEDRRSTREMLLFIYG
jgi:hypothetical protein